MSENPRILYLMENIADIGIAKSLQEELEFDLFAIIDTNKFMRKTFQKQDFLRFKKTWYYRDYVTKINHKLDVTYLENFEKKYNIKLWMIAYSERIFWDYNKYYQFTKDEILSILEIECKLFEEILDQVKPDFVMTKIPDYNQSELFYQICKAKKITILMLNHSRFGYRYLISNDPDKIDNFNLEKYLGKHNKSFNELQEYMKKYTKQTASIKDNFGVSNIQKLKASFRYLLKVCNNNYRE